MNVINTPVILSLIFCGAVLLVLSYVMYKQWMDSTIKHKGKEEYRKREYKRICREKTELNN